MNFCIRRSIVSVYSNLRVCFLDKKDRLMWKELELVRRLSFRFVPGDLKLTLVSSKSIRINFSNKIIYVEEIYLLYQREHDTPDKRYHVIIKINV